MPVLSKAKVVQALMDGDRIMVTHPRPDAASDVTVYTLVDAGRGVNSRVFRGLADRLKPVNDGLFEGVSQTFGWRG